MPILFNDGTKIVVFLGKLFKKKTRIKIVYFKSDDDLNLPGPVII